jgi:ketosteroid isomerase-like protein
MKIAFAVLAACGAVSISGCGGSGSGPAGATAATDQPSLEADLAAIAAFNERYLGAINDEDLAALSGLTTEGHVMLPPNRAPIVGKAANDEANGRAFAQFDIDETWTPIETVVSGDLAFQRGTYTTAARPKSGGAASSSQGGEPSANQSGTPSASQGGAASATDTEGPGNQAATAPAREIRGSFLRIYQRQPNGEWRMTRDMFNTEATQGTRPAQATQPAQGTEPVQATQPAQGTQLAQ